MKNLFSLIVFAASMLLCPALFANGADTCASVAAAITENYTLTMLFGLSVMGILLHWLVDLKKAQSQSLDMTIDHYAKTTWVSSLISLLICCIVIMIRHEFSKLPNFTAYEGAAMVAVGYCGDSLLPLVFGFAKAKGIDVDALQKKE